MAGCEDEHPYAFQMKDGEPFAFAGLWDALEEQDGKWLQSFSIVTIEANELMSSVYTLDLHDYSRWLNATQTGLPSTCCVPLNPDDGRCALQSARGKCQKQRSTDAEQRLKRDLLDRFEKSCLFVLCGHSPCLLDDLLLVLQGQ